MPSTCCSAPSRSETLVNDWTGRPGATARGCPSEQMVRLVCRALPAERRTGLVALDVGSGTGRNALGLAELGFDVTAVDPLPQMLETLREHAEQLGHPIKTCVGGLPRLPVSAASVDLAVCWGLLFTLGGPEQTQMALIELARVLRPGGLLISDWRTDADDLINFGDPWLAGQTYQLRAGTPAGLAGMVYSFWDMRQVKIFHINAGFEIQALQREEITDLLNNQHYSWWQVCATRSRT